jgi:hypothetical protein
VNSRPIEDRIKGFANLPMAYLTGAVGTLAYAGFVTWLEDRGTPPTRAIGLGAYAAFVLAPFLIFVIGWNRQRWDPDYDWFGAAAKADCLRVLIRWGVYWIGVLSVYAMG